MKFSLCIGAYRGQDIVYHLKKIREHGLDGLEFYSWWDIEDLNHIAREQERIGTGIVAVCTRFISLVDQDRREAYINGLKETIEVCKKLNVRSIISQTGDLLPDVPRDIQKQNMIETLKHCAPLLEKEGIVLEIEPLNGLVDHIGYFLQRSDEAVEIIDAVNSPNVKLLFDIYHQQITEGNVIRNATQYIQRINHFHIADNPGRTQPGTGELNYKNILKAIQAAGFQGYVGLECGYTIPTDDAIVQFREEIVSQLE